MKLENFSSYKLVYDIASRIYEHAGTKSEKFALMSAFHIIGSVAQLSWRTQTGVSLCFYQVFAANAGYGKDFYRKSIKNYISAVDPALEGQKPGSVQGLVSELLSWNTLSLTVDEYDQWLEKLIKNPATAEIKDLMLTLYLGEDYLGGTQLKRSRTPRIEKPRLSVAGFCTVKGLISLMTRDILQGGFFSRCLVWDEEKIDLFNFDVPRSFTPDPFEIDWLKKIYMPDGDKLQKTKDGNFKEAMEDANKNYKHESIYHLEHAIKMTPDAGRYLARLRFSGAEKFNEESDLLHEKDDDNTGSFSRYAFIVERLAGILALSRSMDETPELNAEDVRLADVIMHEHRDRVDYLLRFKHNNEYHRKINQLQEFFKSRKNQFLNMKSLRHVLAGVEKHHKHKMIISLFEDGVIEIMDGGKPVSPDALKFDKIPHGSTFHPIID